MTLGSNVVRVVLGVVAVALILGGALLGFLGGGRLSAGLFVPAFWMILSGTVLLVVVLIEVSRYRSEFAERSKLDPGPGGGEDAAPGPPFQRTDEVFLDPTSQRRMRVYADPRTGERRYVAEG